MPTNTTNISTRFITPNASKYLQQMCKHFAHKTEVEFNEHTAKVEFPFGTCHMQTDEIALRIACDITDPNKIEQAIYVIEVHLLRFAWRETVELNWTNDADGQSITRSEELEAGLAEQRTKNVEQRAKLKTMH